MSCFPKITIVTPNLNGAQHLECTIKSVIDQQYPNLEYFIIDGGSTDGSVEIIKKYENHLAYWESCKDDGLYSAVGKGFGKSSGSVMGWINSDDILLNNSLFSIGEIFSLNPKINWIQGHPAVVDSKNRIVYNRSAVNSKFKFHLKDYLKTGEFIQQESTFWTRSLWERAGSFISADYKFAGDFELWMRFFDYEHLYLTDAVLGAFRLGNGAQISVKNYGNYLAECNEIIDNKYETLPDGEKQALKKIKRLRRFSKNFPAFGRLLQPDLFEKQLTNPTGEIKFNFNTQTFKFDQT